MCTYLILAVNLMLLCVERCSPRFGIGHAMCLGLAPWMAAEIPHMVDNGVISNEA